MSRIIAMVGPSGSGKTTTARYLAEAIRKKGENCVIIGRDKLREMMGGLSEKDIHQWYEAEDIKSKEWDVSQFQHTLIRYALSCNQVVIVDNTHLKEKYIRQLSHYGVPVECHVMKTEKIDCIMNDEDRARKVGKEVIDRQYEQYRNLIATYDFKQDKITKPITRDASKQGAVIFDIDGTLAHMVDRKPYDWKKVGQDIVDENVREALWAHQNNGKFIIICTGRDGSCIQETMAWLAENDIVYDDIYIRPEGSYEPDWKVKEDMWRDIAKSYFIEALYDDRNQVVDHARRLGLKVYQVQEGNF
jgi:predicted kinase